MWYECFPSMAIITVAMSLPNIVAWGIHKVWQGNVSLRKRKSVIEINMINELIDDYIIK